MEIKEVFSVKPKIFSIDYYFLLYQISENTKNIFQKLFYDETNKVLNRKNHKNNNQATGRKKKLHYKSSAQLSIHFNIKI
jgi:hypothetical protein